MNRTLRNFVLEIAACGLVLPSLAACGGGDSAGPSGGSSSSSQTTSATGAGGGGGGTAGSAGTGGSTHGAGGSGGNGAGGAAGGDDLHPEACPAPSKQVRGIDGQQIAGVRTCAGIVYDPVVNLPDVSLDLYVPPNYAPASRRPAIIYMHGGGWRAGSKEDVGPHMLDYLKRGYFVLSLNYRLSDFGHTAHPVDMTSGAPPVNATAIQDVKTAIQFVRGHYGDFIDTDAMVAWGFSAGGHLAVLSGVSSNDEEDHPELLGRSPGGESTALKAVVAQSPVLDFDLYIADPGPVCGSLSQNPASCGTPAMPIPKKCDTDGQCSGQNCQFGDEYATTSRSAVEAMLGTAITAPPSGVTRSAMPVTFIDASDPPMYILAGTCDATVPPQGAKALGPTAAAKGATVTVKLVEGSGHTETMDAQTNPTGDDDVREWLKGHGLPAQAP